MRMAKERPEGLTREMMALLDDESAAVREIAVIFLGELRASSAHERLASVAKDDASSNVRDAAARILKKLDE